MRPPSSVRPELRELPPLRDVFDVQREIEARLTVARRERETT